MPSDVPWGKAPGLVKLIYEDQALGLIATDRNASHLAEQLAVKSFVPLIAISADRNLTAVNIPWIFRLPPDTSIEDALGCFSPQPRNRDPTGDGCAKPWPRVRRSAAKCASRLTANCKHTKARRRTARTSTLCKSLGNRSLTGL